jgi:hypothetical protein
MNGLIPPGSDRDLRSDETPFGDFEVSWAGESPWDGGLCFGSDDGRIRFTPADGSLLDSEIHKVVDSHEAINGVAFSGDFIAASTRSEVVLFLPMPDEPGIGRAFYGGGAHGVIATHSGFFVAPMGVGGILLIDPQQGTPQTIRTFGATGKILNYYRAASLGVSPHGGDVLAFAVRRGGLATTILSRPGDAGEMGLLAYPHIDVVDVCSLGSDELPLAAVALGKDRSICLSRDVLTDHQPQRLRFHGLEGDAYRVLATQGHVFVLTSGWLYAFIDLAKRFAEGGEGDALPTTIAGMKFEAVDAFLAYDKILLVMPDRSIASDGVIAIDIASLVLSGRKAMRSDVSGPAIQSLPVNAEALMSEWATPRSEPLTFSPGF